MQSHESSVSVYIQVSDPCDKVRVVKCQFFYTEQHLETKLYTNISVKSMTFCNSWYGQSVKAREVGFVSN